MRKAKIEIRDCWSHNWNGFSVVFKGHTVRTHNTYEEASVHVAEIEQMSPACQQELEMKLLRRIPNYAGGK